MQKNQNYLSKLGKTMCYMSLWVMLMSSVSIWSTFAQSSASQWDTKLGWEACFLPASVEAAYSLDFGSFSSDDVFDWIAYRDGSIVPNGGWDGPSNSHLVVIDRCGSTSRHADLLASDMVDDDQYNATTAPNIHASNLELTNDGTVYFLNWSPENWEVTSTTYWDYTMFNNALQLLQRTAWENPVWWVYGVQPDYRLTIPQFQQPDIYEGTITWTVI